MGDAIPHAPDLRQKGLRVEWSGAVDATPSHRPLVNIYQANGEEIGKTLLKEARLESAGQGIETTGAVNEPGRSGRAERA